MMHDACRMMALTFLDSCLETQTCKIKSIHVSTNDTMRWSRPLAVWVIPLYLHSDVAEIT